MKLEADERLVQRLLDADRSEGNGYAVAMGMIAGTVLSWKSGTCRGKPAQAMQEIEGIVAAMDAAGDLRIAECRRETLAAREKARLSEEERTIKEGIEHGKTADVFDFGC